MPIVYALVACDEKRAPLAEHYDEEPDLKAAAYAREIISMTSPAVQAMSKTGADRLSVTIHEHIYSLLKWGGVWFVVVADDLPHHRELSHALLERISNAFFVKYALTSAENTMKFMKYKSHMMFGNNALPLQKKFGPVLEAQLNVAKENPAELCSMVELQEKVERVRGALVENMEKMVERGEKLEAMEKKTEELAQEAGKFKKTAKKHRYQLWWEHYSKKLAIGTGVGGVGAAAIVIPLLILL